MTVVAPETEARARLTKILEEEFGSENIPVKQGKLHGSYGHEGAAIGVSPGTATPGAGARGNTLSQGSEIVVQFYGKWVKDVEPKAVVDPTIIEERAERFRRRLQGNDVDTSGSWFFNLLRVRYPDDPTGQKTRFEADVQSIGNNSALIETSD
jgi:hypothetical protein